MKKLIIALATTAFASTASAQDSQTFTADELREATQTQLDLQNGGCSVSNNALLGVAVDDLAGNFGTCLKTIMSEMKEISDSVKEQAGFGTDLYKANSTVAGAVGGEIFRNCDLMSTTAKTIAKASNKTGAESAKEQANLVGNYVDSCSETMALAKQAAQQNGVTNFRMNEGSNDLVRLFSFGVRGHFSEPHKKAFIEYVEKQKAGQPATLQVIPN